MAELVAKFVRGGIAMMIVAVLLIGALGTLITETAVFSADRHAEAPYVRTVRQRGTCEGIEILFSPIRGTVMLVCGLPKSTQFGIFVWRITENLGSVVLSREDSYECTVFVGNHQYVENKKTEGAYKPIVYFPNIERAWRDYYGIGGELR